MAQIFLFFIFKRNFTETFKVDAALLSIYELIILELHI